MVYGTQSLSPSTITVLYQECRGQISLRQLARDLSATRTSLKRAKNWLVENRHPAFTNYLPDSPLNAQQAEAIILYRSYTTQGIKGDALTEKMFPDVVTAHAKKKTRSEISLSNITFPLNKPPNSPIPSWRFLTDEIQQTRQRAKPIRQ